ncbi:MAG: ATPase, BadF/BadG/BcrA/BcrD type [Aeromicrobium sp.]|nr:ATPase, BadF/BadG/BcrA/BcrD type [Aeromicrobium sp.]
MSQEALVMGVDVGGTSTRVLVATLDGETRGSGRAAGGNPTAWPTDQAAAALASAVADALQAIDPAAVQAVVLGVAGGSALDDAATAEHFARVWEQSGVQCAPRVVGDLEIAFASATPEPDGTVVVSGTGAAAATIRDHTMVRSADGYGWLLGDVGSGFWLGREAVRHTLARLDEGLPPTVLSEGVLTAVLGADRVGAGTRLVRDLVRTVNSRQPVRLAELANVVEDSAWQGDTEAVAIIEQASTELIHTIERVREPADTNPLVMVGGVLRSGSAVSRSLRTHLAGRFAGPVLAATDGVVGATWLAARSVTNDEKRELASHQRLTLG